MFLLLVLVFRREGGKALWTRLRTYAEVALPIYAVFLLIDRTYQYYRFGSFLNTYVTVFGEQQRMLNPSLPANYPFETPFHVGFLGALFAPEKSIFLFDPLLILTVLIVVVGWKRFDPEIKAFLVTGFFLLLIYVSFYARYTVWSGDSAWGDRYVASAAQFVAFISVPLLLRHREQLGGMLWRMGLGLIAVSAAVQLASVAFWLSLELYQMTTLGHPTFVVWLRFKNIVAFALGKMDAWGLKTESMGYDRWDYQHITAWNFLPFLLQSIGEAPRWMVNSALTIWYVAIAALLSTLVKLRRAFSREVIIA